MINLKQLIKEVDDELNESINIDFKYFKAREVKRKETDLSPKEVDAWIDEAAGYRDYDLHHNIIVSIEKYGPGYKGMNKSRLKKAGNKIYNALQTTRGY